MFTSDSLLLWSLFSAGSIAAGWWLAIRPTASARELATPVALLVLLLAIMMCLLAITGTSAGEFVTGVYHLVVN